MAPNKNCPWRNPTDNLDALLCLYNKNQILLLATFTEQYIFKKSLLFTLLPNYFWAEILHDSTAENACVSVE